MNSTAFVLKLNRFFCYLNHGNDCIVIYLCQVDLPTAVANRILLWSMDVTTDDCFSDMLKVHFHSWPDLPKVTRSALECKSPTAQLNSSSSPASPASHGRRVAHGNFLFFIFQISLTKYFIFYTSDEKRTMHWNFSIQFYNISWNNTSISFYCLCLDRNRIFPSWWNFVNIWFFISDRFVIWIL